jgi:acetyl-CoA acetyltransferase
MSNERQAAIVGVARTDSPRAPDRTSLQLHAQLARAAIRDAGIAKDDIDAVFTAGCDDPSYCEDVVHSVVFCEYAGLQPRVTYTVDLGTCVFVKLLRIAAEGIAAKSYQTALIVCAEPTVSKASRQKAVEKMTAFGHPEFEVPYGITIPAFYALIARRHMHEHGTTSRQLAEVAVTMRRHACLNPMARFREPITVDDVIGSPVIAAPLHRLDCSITTDGGGALLVTSLERARALRRPAVALLGSGQAFTHEHLVATPSYTSFGAVQSGRDAFAEAGLSPQDMDIAFLYDNFTISVISQLEDLGFSEPGAGGPFVADGHIAIGGRLPVNPNGGLLSEGHPGRPGGILHLIEAVQQLRGECGKRQVAGASTALVHGVGGVMSNHATAILGRAL